jgi:hypothetical protein
VGKKEAVSDPSARSLRNRLGIAKAVRKAEYRAPAPNIDVARESRKSPIKRDTTVRKETIPMFLSFFDTVRLAARLDAWRV